MTFFLCCISTLVHFHHGLNVYVWSSGLGKVSSAILISGGGGKRNIIIYELHPQWKLHYVGHTLSLPHHQKEKKSLENTIKNTCTLLVIFNKWCMRGFAAQIYNYPPPLSVIYVERDRHAYNNKKKYKRWKWKVIMILTIFFYLHNCEIIVNRGM